MAVPLQVFVRLGECRKQLVPLASVAPELQPHVVASQTKSPPTLSDEDDDDDCRLVSIQPLSAQELLTHQLLMLLSIKKELLPDRLDFRVIAIDPNKPPAEFRHHSLKETPALFDPNTQTACDHENEILEYLDREYPTPQLQLEQPDEDDEELDGFREENEGDKITQLGCELMTKFLAFVKGLVDESQLTRLLTRLDEFLTEKGTRWILRDSISKYDIELLPKLHQIKIACKEIYGYEIPARLNAFWRYLCRGYNCPAFVSWVPSDQEIVLHYRAITNKTPSKQTLDQRRALMNCNSRFTLNVAKAKEDYV